MANTYTYEDFLRAMEQSGLGGQFSQADLNLARNNPDAGMSLLGYKTDYANATTDELRALANQGAEGIRSSYGGYTGGGDGGSFRLNPMSPRQYTYGEAPSFTDNYADRIEAALAATQNRQPYSYAQAAPEYESRYDPQIQETIAGILGRGEFEYDPSTDPVWSAYKKQYTREGQRATADALGQAAAATGGMPSSYAVTAASQAGDYYAAQMADKIPELYQDAYNRYLQEYQMKLSDLSALRGLESDDYSKYRDQLSQYNTDRSFDYAAWLDQQKFTQQDFDNLRALRSDEYDMYRDALSQYNTDRSFNYGQWLDEIQNQQARRQEEWDRAESAAKYGDYSFLKSKGVDTSSAEYADLVSRGVQAAQYGDYSLLNQAGIDTSTAQFKEQLAIAELRAAVGDFSGYASLGIDTSNAELMKALEIQAKQASIASTYANMPTEEDRALERQLQQARIASTYAGMPTEEERALDQLYKQAQIANLTQKSTGSSGGTGGTVSGGTISDDEYAYFNSLSPTKQLEYAKLAYNNFDDDTFYRMLGMNPDGSKTGGGSGTSGGTGTVAALTSDTLNQYLEGIRAAKIAGDPEAATMSDALALIESLDGYDEKTMGKTVKEYLKRLYQKPNASGVGGYTISQN